MVYEVSHIVHFGTVLRKSARISRNLAVAQVHACTRGTRTHSRAAWAIRKGMRKDTAYDSGTESSATSPGSGVTVWRIKTEHQRERGRVTLPAIMPSRNCWTGCWAHVSPGSGPRYPDGLEPHLFFILFCHAFIFQFEQYFFFCLPSLPETE